VSSAPRLQVHAVWLWETFVFRPLLVTRASATRGLTIARTALVAQRVRVCGDFVELMASEKSPRLAVRGACGITVVVRQRDILRVASSVTRILLVQLDASAHGTRAPRYI
jgi:hypothetical protein